MVSQIRAWEGAGASYVKSLAGAVLTEREPVETEQKLE